MPDLPPATLLAFDYGLRRIGVAVGQALTGTASPRPAVGARDGAPDWDAISKLIDEWQPAAIVIGVPYNMDGSRQEMTDRAERFGRQLHGRFQLPVHVVDERLSSLEGEERLRVARREGRRGRIQKPDVDSAAACVLLETWLNDQRNS